METILREAHKRDIIIYIYYVKEKNNILWSHNPYLWSIIILINPISLEQSFMSNFQFSRKFYNYNHLGNNFQFKPLTRAAKLTFRATSVRGQILINLYETIYTNVFEVAEFKFEVKFCSERFVNMKLLIMRLSCF